jgi:cell division septal protein FtsQ
MPRLTRFVQLYPKLSGEVEARLRGVDLRYTNGFTAHWEMLPDMHSNEAGPAVEGTASRLAGI